MENRGLVGRRKLRRTGVMKAMVSRNSPGSNLLSWHSGGSWIKFEEVDDELKWLPTMNIMPNAKSR